MISKRGIGLITLIVSISILAITLATAASVLITASKATKHAANVTAASDFAESQLERVRSQPYGSIGTMSVTNNLPKLPGAKCDVSVSKSEPGLREITVAFAWSESKTPYTVRFSTLISGRQRR